MIFHETPLAGARLIAPEPRGDARGAFARLFCEREFAAQGLETRFVNLNHSTSPQAGTLRGLHYQIGEAAEAKLVRCVRGSLFDVVLDLRPESRSFGRWFGATLNAADGRMMYLPRGCAHAFLTLEPDTEAIYLVSAHYDPAAERGLRWNDPRFGVAWPKAPAEISDKDRSWPDFDPGYHAIDRLAFA